MMEEAVLEAEVGGTLEAGGALPVSLNSSKDVVGSGASVVLASPSSVFSSADVSSGWFSSSVFVASPCGASVMVARSGSSSGGFSSGFSSFGGGLGGLSS
jgi:hypothetical protein